MKTALQAWKAPAGAYTVKSLVKALNILEVLADGEQPSYSLTELSRRLRLHVSTVHRLLVNLTREGFVEQDPLNGAYRLGYGVMRMGLKVLSRLDFRQVAAPLLRRLNEQTQETVHLAILQGQHALSIDNYGSPQPVSLDAPLGSVLPLYCTGVGKAILAHQDDAFLKALAESPGLVRRTPHTFTSLPQLRKELARVREEGYAVDNEEVVEGLRCVGAPLFEHSGLVRAAFSVAGPAMRITAARLPGIVRLVCETSREISHRLGYSPSPARGQEAKS